MKSVFSSRIVRVAIFLAIPIAVYFINVEVQSYLGRQAVHATGFTSLSLDQAFQKARAEDKLVIVEVAAIWCSTCRRLDKDVFSNEGVRKVVNEKYIFSRLEFESEAGTAFLEKYESYGFPNLWLLDSDGRVVKKLNVVFDPDAFLGQLPQ
ncbi:MAG: thioredoxin family protein [Pyrinomonadaceae bacterium]